MASTFSFLKTAQVLLEVIPSADEALRNLGTFAFVALHIFSTVGRHVTAFMELLFIIEVLEEIHTEMQGIIKFPHLATTSLY